MELNRLPLEKWNYQHIQPAHFSYLRGMLRMEKDGVSISGSGKPAESYTGNVYWKNYELITNLIPVKGTRHNVLFRVQGGIKCLAAGLAENQTLRLYKKEKEYQVLEEVPYKWQIGVSYQLKIVIINNQIDVWINGKRLLNKKIESIYDSGCIGFGNDQGSRTIYTYYMVKVLK
jgi:hypothetical protein